MSSPAIYLAVQSLRRRPVRTLITLAAVTVMAGGGFLTTAAVRGVSLGLASSLQRLGPDLVVVPAGSQERVRAFLDGGEPAAPDGGVQAVPDRSQPLKGLASDIVKRLSALSEVEAVSPQFWLGRIGLPQVARPVDLIGYDPGTDFALRPWLPPGSRRAGAG